ncbi:MAG: hypothetical protein M3072_07625 [Candidatus Dormibacteraeota bacterium]|nr:hypothetical protein [Candidatus Dormibacteraeota bacterium]
MPNRQGLDELLAELYGGDPDDFVARRGALVKQLRKDGRAELARQILAARRPAVNLWAANHLAEFAPTVLEELLESGRRLQVAQIAALEGRAVIDLRGLLSAHSIALQRAVDGAARFLGSRDRDASDAVRRRLQTTLRAVSLGARELGEALAAGRLTAEPEQEGFGGFASVVVQTGAPGRKAAVAEPMPKAEPKRQLASGSDPDLLARVETAKSAADVQRRLARQLDAEAAELARRAERLAEEATGAAAAAAEARKRATTAADQAERLADEAERAAAAVATVRHSAVAAARPTGRVT